jgi:hypothetical protein
MTIGLASLWMLLPPRIDLRFLFFCPFSPFPPAGDPRRSGFSFGTFSFVRW